MIFDKLWIQHAFFYKQFPYWPFVSSCTHGIMAMPLPLAQMKLKLSMAHAKDHKRHEVS
jgi:hypothetical protein